MGLVKSRAGRHFRALLRYGTLLRLWNIGIVEIERHLKRSRLHGHPYIAVIDPLNVCNLKCPFCPTGRGALPLPPGRMPLDRYREVVDRLAPHLVKLILYNWGEPFLHKDILEMIRHAHMKGIATAVSSNLNVLPEGGGEALVRSGLDDLIVSCDGLTQETYSVYRRGGSLDKVIAHLHDISEARKKLKSRTPFIELQFLVFRHNEHEVAGFREFARRIGADTARIARPYVNLESTEIQPARNPEYVRPEYLEGKESEPTHANIFSPDADQATCITQNPPPLSCFWPWRAVVINWNGQVDPCCGKNYHMPFGNIFEETFEAVWNSPAYIAAREWIAGKRGRNDWPDIVCRGCGGYR